MRQRIPVASKKPLPTPQPNPPSLDELFKLLVSHLPPAHLDESQSPGSFAHEADEIVLDTEVGGFHYFLVRAAKSARGQVALSPREKEIVRMVAQGHPNKIIAGVLNISSWTVCTHLRRVFAKLGVGSRAAMVARLLEMGSIRGVPRSPERSEVDFRGASHAFPAPNPKRSVAASGIDRQPPVPRRTA